MVTVFLRGGLGNQMFQYALGLCLAKKNNTGLRLDTVFLCDRFPRREFSYRNYDLGVFALAPRFTLLSRISAAIPIPGLWLALDLAAIKIGNVFGVRRIIKETDGKIFDPAALRASGNMVLWGRWQTEKYFAECAEEVRRAFQFKNALAGEAAQVAEKIEKINSVSVHIRRGDYVRFKSTERLYGKADLSYYERAAAYMADRVNNPHFFVFSDDVAWCRENLKLAFPTTFVSEQAAGPHDAFHMELMSLCKHHIVTNSTFSWWGAWLNANPQKIVIAPKRWYGDPAIKTDIVPERWIKI